MELNPGVADAGTSPSIGGTVIGGTTGSVLFINPTNTLAQDNANFFWDPTNKRLGIGTTTPLQPIHVFSATATQAIRVESGLTTGLARFQLVNDSAKIISYSVNGSATANTGPTNIPNSGLIQSTGAGGLILNTSDAAGTIQLSTGGIANSNIRVTLTAAGNLVAGNSTGNFRIESVNPTGGTTERLLAVTNVNAPATSSAVKSLFLAAGNGTAYSLGYAVIGAQLGNNAFINYMNLTPFGTDFQLPVSTANNKGYQSATTLGQTVPLAVITSGNIVQLGMNYPAADPLEIYTGATTTNITFKEKTTNTTLATLTGTGNFTNTGYVKTQVTVVASLPAAATAGVGARSFVTDALAPTFGSTVTGGGTVAVPVYSDGTNWNVG